MKKDKLSFYNRSLTEKQAKIIINAEQYRIPCDNNIGIAPAWNKKTKQGDLISMSYCPICGTIHYHGEVKPNVYDNRIAHCYIPHNLIETPYEYYNLLLQNGDIPEDVFKAGEIFKQLSYTYMRRHHNRTVNDKFDINRILKIAEKRLIGV